MLKTEDKDKITETKQLYDDLMKKISNLCAEAEEKLRELNSQHVGESK
jgi:hypothetical protein